MKNIFFGLAILGIVILIFRLGSFRLSKTIYKTKDCEQFTIDHLELRTGVNLPKLLELNCNFDDQNDLKIHEIQIDTNEVDIPSYYQNYPYVEIDSLNPSYLFLDSTLVNFKNPNLLGFKQTTSNHNSEFILNSLNGKMWIAINYY